MLNKSSMKSQPSLANQNKKWCILTISAAMVILALIAATVIIVDPFFQYHKPFEKIPYTFSSQVYQNLGIVRHFEYDSLITGSSVTVNFKPSYFKEVLGDNAVKTPINGASTKSLYLVLKKALESNPDLRTVYVGLDIFMMDGKDVDYIRFPLPDYMHDANPFNDVSYLLNKDVLFNDVELGIRKAIHGEAATSFDNAHAWHDAVTSQYKAINATKDSAPEVKRAEHPGGTLSERMAYTQNHLKTNILPLIEAYPNTKFIIFYPPYNILYWYTNYAEFKLANLRASIEALLPYGNVEQFLFQSNAEIVTNMYLYLDVVHYRSDINAYMTDCFKSGTHKLTSENYEAELAKLQSLAYNFDYGLLLGDSNPFIGESNLLKYLDKLDDARYLTFIAVQANTPVSVGDLFSSRDSRRSGLEVSQTGNGYVAIINGSETIFQEASDNAILFDSEVYGLDVSLISEKRDNMNYIEIIIDNVRYTTNQAGINIVVYDKELRRVMDNIAVNVENGNISRA